MPWRPKTEGEMEFDPDPEGEGVWYASSMSVINSVTSKTTKHQAEFNGRGCGCDRCKPTLEEVKDNSDRGNWLMDQPKSRWDIRRAIPDQDNMWSAEMDLNKIAKKRAKGQGLLGDGKQKT